jgi:hypothetical protein
MTVLGVAVALLIAVLVAARSDGDGPDVGGAQEALGLVVSGAGLLLEIAGLVLSWRSGMFRGAFRQPGMVLTRRQQRELAAQVRGRAPVDRRRLPLARDLARRVIGQRRFLVFLSGVAVLQVGQAISAPASWRVWSSAGLLVLYLVGGVLGFRDARRARAFLDQHPEPAVEQAG